MSVQTVAPSTTAITLDEAKDHLRIDGPLEDGYITALIKVATESVEAMGREALIQQTRRMDSFGFCDEMRLDVGPLSSVSGITYVASGATTLSTLSTDVYQVDAEHNRVLRANGQVWPATADERYNAVQITYVTGHATSSTAVPARYKHAIKMLVDRWYNDRTDYKTGTIVQQLPHAVMDIIRPQRNYRFV